MAEIFAKLKWNKIDCEMSPEFAKELVWENRHHTLTDQLYLLGKQNHRLFRVAGKVDVVLVDSPLLLNVVYNELYNKSDDPIQSNFNAALENLVVATKATYNNLNIFLKRTKPYNPNGRNQTEEESDNLSHIIKNLLDRYETEYVTLNADTDTADMIYNIIINKINK